MDEEDKAQYLAAMDQVQADVHARASDSSLRDTPMGGLSGGLLEDVIMGSAAAVGDRLSPYFPALPKITPPATLAADIGRGLPLVAAASSLPATGLAGMAAQGLAAAGYEALDPKSTTGSIVGSGLTAGALTGAFDLAGRAVSGISQRVQDAISGKAAGIRKTQDFALRNLSETLGGMGQFNRQQQGVIDRAAAGAIGEEAANVASEVRQAAATRIGKIMDAALPTSAVDVAPAYLALDAIPAANFPGKADVLAKVARAESSPIGYQVATRELRDTARTMSRGNNYDWAQEVAKGLDLLHEAGAAAGAADTGVVREQYKNLMLIESMGMARRTGSVPALSAEEKIFRSYGNSVSRTAGAGTRDFTQNFISTVTTAASEAAQRFRSSGTTERGVQAEVAKDVTGFLTGSTSPSGLARTVGTVAGVGPLLGAAAMGTKSQEAGLAGALAAQVANERTKKALRK